MRNRPFSRLFCWCGLSNLAHIMGVAVRETTRDMRHGHAESDGKFAENAPEDPAHHENGNEHGDQRNAHGEHRETYLLGPLQSRFQRSHAFFQIARDVFNHHDGIVHHKARRNGQRHQGKIVDGIAQQVHHAKGSDQRYRHGHARNGRGPNAVEKSKNHQDHQDDGNHQS